MESFSDSSQVEIIEACNSSVYDMFSVNFVSSISVFGVGISF